MCIIPITRHYSVPGSSFFVYLAWLYPTPVHFVVHLFPLIYYHPALVAAGRTISPSDNLSDHKEDSEEMNLEVTGGEIVTREVGVEEVEMEKKDLSGAAGGGGGSFAKPWTGKIKVSADHDDSVVVLRKGSNTSDKPDPLRRIGTPIMRTGSPLVRTGSPLVRTGSPLVRTTSPLDDVKRKARASVISIASNISNRFRKSVDLNEEEVEKLVSMSTIIDSSDSSGEEGRCVCVCTCSYNIQSLQYCSCG